MLKNIIAENPRFFIKS